MATFAQDQINRVATWNSIGVGLLRDLSDRVGSLREVDNLRAENASIHSRMGELEKSEEASRKRAEEVEDKSALVVSQLEAEKDEAKRRLEEALNHAKGLETTHTEALARLQAECDAKVKAAEGKCIEVEGVNIKLRLDLASRMEKIADLNQELDDATDDFKGAVYDSFCNCGRQLRLANPGVELSFKGVSPDYVFNRSGILVHSDSLKPVNLKEARQVAFDPELDYEVKQPTVKVEAKDSVGAGPSQTAS